MLYTHLLEMSMTSVNVSSYFFRNVWPTDVLSATWLRRSNNDTKNINPRIDSQTPRANEMRSSGPRSNTDPAATPIEPNTDIRSSEAGGTMKLRCWNGRTPNLLLMETDFHAVTISHDTNSTAYLSILSKKGKAPHVQLAFGCTD
jgi:hypothetical protein